MSKMPLTYDDPLVAVFLRTLAWERYKANRKDIPVWEQAEELVQSARADLGLKETKGGAPHAFIQSLRKPENGFLSEVDSDPVEDGWRDKKAWRLLNLPSHRIVRMLSHNPICKELPNPVDGFRQYSVSLRGAAMPKLRVIVGQARPNKNLLDEGTKGLYFLREHRENPAVDALYVGKSDEFGTRWKGHEARQFHWWVFVGPEEDNRHFSLDTLAAAESLLISFWNELCHLTNQNRASDKEPVFACLQPAILLVEAASAVLLWLIRDKKRREMKLDEWNLPFKECSAHHWPKCYLKPSNENSDSGGV
jgi:hypothetical protein